MKTLLIALSLAIPMAASAAPVDVYRSDGVFVATYQMDFLPQAGEAASSTAGCFNIQAVYYHALTETQVVLGYPSASVVLGAKQLGCIEPSNPIYYKEAQE